HGISMVRRTPKCGCSQDRTPEPPHNGQSSLRDLSESSAVTTRVLPVRGEPGAETARAVHHVTEIHRASSLTFPEANTTITAGSEHRVTRCTNHPFAGCGPL